MKDYRRGLSLWLVFLASFAMGQAPLGINYQGIARLADGSPLVASNIGIRVAITSGPNGTVNYSEEHHVTTNEFGLFILVIGQGQSSGSLSDVDWSTGNQWLQIELSENDNGSYVTVGSQQLLSVPYAMYAQQSGGNLAPGFGIDISNGKVNNVLPDQVISLTGQGSVNVTGTYPNFVIDGIDQVDDADADPANELQDLQLAGNNLSITKNGAASPIDLSGYLDNTDNQNLSNVLVQGSDANGSVISNLGDPSAVQDASTKNYVDNQDAALQSDIFTNTNNISTNSGDIASNATDIATEISDRNLADTGLQSELNATQTGAGLASSGAYVPDATTTYINAASSLANADNLLDIEVSTNASDITTNASGISVNSVNLSTETSNRTTADTNLQSELNATQTGAGLASSGAYVPDATTTYINAASSLANADKLLDTQVSANASDITTNASGISVNSTNILTETSNRTTADTNLQNELNATQTGAGLAGSGAYIPDVTTTYINAASSLANADKLLDTQVAGNATNITTLTSRLDNTFAFLADFSINIGSALTKTPVTLTPALDNFGQINANEITIGATGLYLILVDAERINSDVNFDQLFIRINAADSNVPLLANLLNFGRTQILQLTAGDKISLVATTGGPMSFTVNGKISGYKITD